jgi:hypothetical protein
VVVRGSFSCLRRRGFETRAGWTGYLFAERGNFEAVTLNNVQPTEISVNRRPPLVGYENWILF